MSWVLLGVISFLGSASNGSTVLVMSSEVSPSFPSVDDPSWQCGDKHSLCLDSVPDIPQREDSGGHRPVNILVSL